MIQKLFLLSALCLSTQLATAFEPPANSILLIEEDFEGGELPKGWSVQTGAWTAEDGVLKGSEIESDNHSAAARRSVKTGDAVYQLKFKLSAETKAFHFGFDPVPGALEKRGHLFSVIITPTGWQILKHIDKDKPKEDPNEVIAKADQTFVVGQWYQLRVTTWANTVKAIVDDMEPLTGQHPTFGVEKPALVFRAIGSGVEIDEIRVWAPKK